MNWDSIQIRDRKKILQVSHKYNLSHLGSCLSAVDIISAVYAVKNPQDKFILSCGHAGLALYAVLEREGAADAEKLFQKHGVHPNRDLKNGIYCSSGSLGHGLPIALGMALSDRKKQVFCLISDGEMAEGSIWESLRIAAEYQVSNLRLVVNANGFGAYSEIDCKDLASKISSFGWDLEMIEDDPKKIKQALGKRLTSPKALVVLTTVEQFPFLKGQDAHYKVMSEEEYLLAEEILG